MLRGHISPRAGRMTNRERLNRALSLMLLESNGLAREDAYARTIQTWLLANGGRPHVPRRAIADGKGVASLRP